MWLSLLLNERKRIRLHDGSNLKLHFKSYITPHISDDTFHTSIAFIYWCLLCCFPTKIMSQKMKFNRMEIRGQKKKKKLIINYASSTTQHVLFEIFWLQKGKHDETHEIFVVNQFSSYVAVHNAWSQMPISTQTKELK